MTVVFVHGVPETASIWDRLRARIGGDSVALALPGFGTPRPNGFGATMDEYADWLAGELKAIDGPIDLVGHDWGGMLTSRVVTTAAAPLRSWVTDAITIVDPSFEWHDLAKIWQTPGDGEAFWASMLAAPPADTAPLFVALGVPEADALAMIAAINETTTACILDLYRSSANIGTDWEAKERVTVPGLVLLGSADPYADETRARPVAARLGADVTVVDGAGHWWPLQSTEQAADALQSFWSTLA